MCCRGGDCSQAEVPPDAQRDTWCNAAGGMADTLTHQTREPISAKAACALGARVKRRIAVRRDACHEAFRDHLVLVVDVSRRIPACVQRRGLYGFSRTMSVIRWTWEAAEAKSALARSKSAAELAVSNVLSMMTDDRGLAVYCNGVADSLAVAACASIGATAQPMSSTRERHLACDPSSRGARKVCQ